MSRRSGAIPSTTRGRAEIVALLLVGSVAAAAVVGGTPDPSANPPASRLGSSPGACPLTLPQEHTAGQAFEKMMPVLTHPRCFNCHGGVDPFKPFEDGGHVGGAMTWPEDLNECRDCHTGVRNLRSPDRPAFWSTPPSFFFFVGKSSRELCNQFKEIELSPVKFVGHIINENGGVQFTEAAYRGDRALNALGRGVFKDETGHDMVAEPPPIPHAQLVAHAREWANTVGEAGWKIPDCGCRLSGDAWEGTVTTSWTQREPGFGTLTETMNATARFEIDSSFMAAGDPALYWKSTSGVIKWTITATGGVCSTSASGTVPISLGSDGNPWGLIRMEPDSTGAIGYSVGIGPWPEEYVHRYVYRCRNESLSYVLPGIPYAMHSWWHHAEGATLSPDGRSMKGAFTAPAMLGTIRWAWDFRLVR